jgi:branched-chain amino acid transport system permease protein
MMDNVFFPDSHLISASTGSLIIRPPSLGGHALTTDRSELWLLAGVVALYMIGIYAIRRSPYGHALAALRDAPAAASTLGLNLTRVKVTVFAISSGMAGLAGCFYGVVNAQVSANMFNYQTSLSALLILAIYGLGSVPGAIVGAVFYVVLYQLMPTWIHSTTWVEGLQPFLIAGGVINLVVHPEGVIAQNRALIRRRLHRSNTPTVDVSEPLGIDAQLTNLTSGVG